MKRKMILFIAKIVKLLRNFIERMQKESRRKDWHSLLRKELSSSSSFESLTEEEKNICKNFWNKYPVKYDPDWCMFYKNKTGIFDPRFIPNDIHFADIDYYLNDWKEAKYIDDKNYYSLLFNGVKQPNTVVRIINGKCFLEDYTPINKEIALSVLSKSQKLVFKKSKESCGGENIFLWDSKKDSFDALLDNLNAAISNKEYIIQDYLTQSEKLSKIYSNSVNTMRITTLVINDDVHFLAAILKMGAGQMEVDNVHWGGCSCGIDKNGKLKKYGSDVSGNNIDKHPSGFVFEGFEVPGFNEAKKMVCELHKRLGRFRLVGWDVAIDENDTPVLIEANFCRSAIDFQQWNNGPLFGDLTEQVLDEVYFSNKK